MRYPWLALPLAIALGFSLTIAAAAETVNARMRLNRKLPAGADDQGRPLLFTPKPVQVGSTHSHWDTSASPNLLMEPSISSDLDVPELDLTEPAMIDLGWEPGTSNVRVSYSDSAGDGFNDPDLGDARKAALEMATQVWGAVLGSEIDINVDASFSSLRCGDTGATLAQAGPRFVFTDFGAGEPGTWYPGPLAEALAGQNLSINDDSNENAADLSIRFNSEIDEECLAQGSRYYYGLDDDIPNGQISFVTVALHELGHGLGFIGLVDETTGELFRRRPDIFTLLTFDNKKNKYWDEMSDSQRKKSAKRPRRVVFDGEQAAARAKKLLKGRRVVEIMEPESLAGTYDIGTATFGPSLKRKGVRADLALITDGSPNPTFGCQPLTNAAEVSGKIAVIDRGECLFVVKVKNAQNAGAVGVIIVHNESGPPPDLGGSDSTIEIPAVRIGKKDGRKIKRVLKR